MQRNVLGIAVLALLAGCPPLRFEREALASEVVGPEGGVIEGPGIALAVPPGALGEAREISIFVDEDSDLGFETVTPVYQFEPSGLVFDAPTTVTFETPPGASGVVLWSRPGAPGEFDVIGSSEGGLATAEVAHFSEGFVADCRPRCHCAANEGYSLALCQTDPGEANTRCEEEDTVVASSGANACGMSQGSSCSGYGLVTIEAVLCGCTGNAPVFTNTPMATGLCRRPWRNVPGTNNWYCETDLEGNAPTSPANTYATVAWKQSEGSCQGYWLDQRNTQSSNGGSIAGTLTGCDTVARAIGSEWQTMAGGLVCDWVRTEDDQPVVCSSGMRGEFLGFPPRTAQARAESQRVVDAMNEQGLATDRRSAVAVFTHADDTVSVGYSREGPDLGVARELSARLNRGLPQQRYFVGFESDETMTAANLCGIQNTEGVCAEPRAANAARARARSTGPDGAMRGYTPITGFDVRTRSATNPHPYTGANADCSTAEPSQMEACPTCGHEANIHRYMTWANGAD